MTRRPRPYKEKRSSKPTREPYDVVLIVCEGSKSEPSYLHSIVSELRLSSANIVVVGEGCGSSPGAVVKYAIKKFERDGGYDQVFCVFDRDEHADYDAALDRCRNTRKKGEKALVNFKAITSNPCFEYWLILHFDETSKPFVRKGNETAALSAVRHLKKFIADYEKGSTDIYNKVRDGEIAAIKRAGRYRQEGLDNPHTKMDELISYLRSVRNSRQ